jgi:hypothetical protein
MRRTHVEKEFGKDRKNCLCVVSCKETTRVAKRSRVSWEEVGEQGVRKGGGTGREDMPLGRDVLAWWSSSYGTRRPGETHLVAWWRRTGGRGRVESEKEGGGKSRDGGLK